MKPKVVAKRSDMAASLILKSQRREASSKLATKMVTYIEHSVHGDHAVYGCICSVRDQELQIHTRTVIIPHRAAYGCIR